MLLRETNSFSQNPTPLSLVDAEEPTPSPNEVLIRVKACSVCHTELDEIEGRMKPQLPIILGHQVVGTILESGGSPLAQEPASALHIGQRIGVAWIASACGKCKYCLAGNENLCADFVATGRDVNGG